MITAPVSIYDVQRALGANSPDLGTLCQNANINKFARFKPFRYNALFFASDAAQLTAAKAVNFGTGIVSCGTLTFASKYQDVWTHLAPRGAGGGAGGYNEMYRLTDFKNYQHKKWQLGDAGDGRAFYTIFNGYLSIPGSRVSNQDTISFNMQCRENEDDADLGLLYPYDFANAAKDFSGYYVGIAVLDSNNDVWVIAQPHISDFFTGTSLYTGIRAQISNSIANGTIKIAPVLTENHTIVSGEAKWTNSYNGDIIILNGAYLSATKSPHTDNLQTTVAFVVGASSITLNFTIKNETGSPVTVSNLICYLLSDGAFTNEHDNGYTGPDYQGEGAVAYIMRTWPRNYKQGDIMSHDWDGGYSNPDQLAARYYNAYSDFYAANGNTNIIYNGSTITFSKTFNYTQDDFGSYANGAWALLCVALPSDSEVREYSSINS